ncbi:hypothetical protein GEMRC1_003697 [Eukaryota sp. GEM-RC1]
MIFAFIEQNWNSTTLKQTRHAKNCYSGKVTHLLHSLPLYLSITPVEALPIRTDFLAFLLSVDPAALNNHIFILVVLVSLRLNGGPNLLSLVVVRILSLSSVDVTQVKKIFLFRQVVFSW